VSVESKVSDAYGKLMESTKELFILQSMGSIVYWDMETKMPPKGVNLRSQQLALLEKIGHRMLTDPEKGKLINEIIDHPDYGSLKEVEKRNVFLTKKVYDEATKLPEELVVETARQQALTVNVWKKAKAAKDYSMFRPDLEKLFDLKKRAAEILMDVKGTSTPYDALIDLFEPGMTADMIDKVFTGMRKGLIEIIDKCRDSESQPDTSFMNRGVPVETQRSIAEALTDLIGYKTKGPEAGGRIDETEHPFATGYYDDVRITTHYHDEKFASSVFSVLHEGGHALYEQGLPAEWIYQPVGTACSMGIHESQSRFVENMVGRSTQFWSHFLPQLKTMTGDVLTDVSLTDFVRAINRVQPSKIRIEADEVTYGLHIIIRFEMERDLLAGKVNFDELPQAWNDKYREYLGVEIKDDSEGVMQDTHWAGGAYGYFPSYALGNLYGGMLLDKMKADLPDMMEKIAAGSFKEAGGWLVENVHRHGDLHDPADLIKKITGRSLTYTPFLEYLEDKFSQLYGF
jgi:carboxypeptidase Taq